ncbi:MAG: tol-pal system protein YbgF [Thermodesulfobacteriota bacterium]
MPKIFKWLLPALLILPLSSCVYDREMAYFNDQITSLNRKVSSLEEAAGGDLPSALETMQASQAGMRLEVDQLKTEVSEISGRTEDNEHIVRRIVEQDLSQQDAMKARIEELTEELETLNRLVLHQQQYLGLEPPEELKPREPPEDLPLEPSQIEMPPPEPQERMPSGEVELYEYALGLHRQGKHEEARRAFKNFLDQFPKSNRADNAHFWIAETFMSDQQYEQAILAYQNVIKDFPKGNKAANAMYRQALAFLEIKDKTSARLLLNKVIKEHPDTSDAELAKSKLDSL